MSCRTPHKRARWSSVPSVDLVIGMLVIALAETRWKDNLEEHQSNITLMEAHAMSYHAVRACLVQRTDRSDMMVSLRQTQCLV
jgi:hypothetical protein